jgi:uncharacterized protein YuzE
MTTISRNGIPIRLPNDRWQTYDPEADVLYIDFHNPPKSSDDSELTDDDIVIRYDDREEIVGLTILHVSQRTEPQIHPREARSNSPSDLSSNPSNP